MRKDILNSILQLKEVKDLINKSEIARRFNCSINTVNRYLNIQDSNKSSRKYSSKLDDFKGIIIEKTDYFSANGRSIYNFIKEKGFIGSYGTVSNPNSFNLSNLSLNKVKSSKPSIISHAIN